MGIARLFTGVLKNDRSEQEFDHLVRRCHKQAYNVAFRLTGNHADADDLTQETFLRAFRFFNKYNRDMPFENWLYRIMSRVFIDEIRKKPKYKTQSLDQPINVANSGDREILFEIPDFESNPEHALLSDMLDEQLQTALNALPEEFRIAVILADIEGLSYEEISESMSCSLGTVRSRLHRGRKLLRSKLIAAKEADYSGAAAQNKATGTTTGLYQQTNAFSGDRA